MVKKKQISAYLMLQTYEKLKSIANDRGWSISQAIDDVVRNLKEDKEEQNVS